MTDKPTKSRDQELIERCASLLDGLIASLESDLHGDGEHSAVVADICRATTSAASVAAEIRARDKLALAQRHALTVPLVMEWFRKLPEAERNRFCRELAAVMSDESVLA